MAQLTISKKRLEDLYNQYNKREFVHPDPLEFLYNYDDIRDREIAGLIASSLAYGRVRQILKSVDIILKKMGRSPYDFLQKKSEKDIHSEIPNFKHRFHTATDITALLSGIKRVLKEKVSLENLFLEALKISDADTVKAAGHFVKGISGKENVLLLSDPSKGSACKRLFLFLRWMVRCDAVDPGGWKNVSPEKLIVPLDTHMHNIGLKLNATGRKQANLRTAIEITDSFRAISPEDPVKYDFPLTRFGIRDELKISEIFA